MEGTNEIMCAAEIMAICSATNAKLEAMKEANQTRQQNGHANAYDDGAFFELAQEHEAAVDAKRRHWIG